jgi:hypothetical protein
MLSTSLGPLKTNFSNNKPSFPSYKIIASSKKWPINTISFSLSKKFSIDRDTNKVGLSKVIEILPSSTNPSSKELGVTPLLTSKTQMELYPPPRSN